MLKFPQGVTIFTLMCLLGQKCAPIMLPIYIIFPILALIKAPKPTVISWVCLKPGVSISKAGQQDFVVEQSLVFS